MKTRRRILLCLVAGALLLAASAAAAFGSVSGYTQYKQAVKGLLFTEENYTAQAQFRLTVDGEILETAEVSYAAAGKDRAYSSQENRGQTCYREYRTMENGVVTSFTEDSWFYTRAEVEDTDLWSELLGSRVDPEMERRLNTFAENAVDLVVGELKNNVVQLAREGDETLYQVQVARSQIPGLFNAGLSVLAYYNVGEPQQRFLAYEEGYQSLLLARFQAATGAVLSQEDRDHYIQGGGDPAWQASHPGLIQRIDAFEASDWRAEDTALLEAKDQGVLYLKNDGTYVDYDTVNQFLADFPQRRCDYLYYYLGGDVSLTDVQCTFSLDQAGRLTANQFQVNLKTIDSAGGRHTMQLAADLTFTNYGTTAVSPLDVGERVEWS